MTLVRLLDWKRLQFRTPAVGRLRYPVTILVDGDKTKIVLQAIQIPPNKRRAFPRDIVFGTATTVKKYKSLPDHVIHLQSRAAIIFSINQTIVIVVNFIMAGVYGFLAFGPRIFVSPPRAAVA
jgi:hypothetical protein